MDRKRSRAAGQSSARLGARAAYPLKTEGRLRRVVLAGTPVEYRLIRAHRESIGMQIDHRGLVVRAPSWVSVRDVDVALSERARWVLESLATWCGANRDTLPSEWRAGAPLLYQGRALTLALFPARKHAIAADLVNLTVLHPTPADQAEVSSFVCRWLKDQALALFVPRALDFARRLKARVPSVRLSDARTQWGSCNERGEIRINWRLVQLAPRLGDYVVAHEVAHLVELNHSPRFWALVERLLPGHAECRRELDALTPLLE